MNIESFGFLMYICTRENRCSLSLSVIEVSPDPDVSDRNLSVVFIKNLFIQNHWTNFAQSALVPFLTFDTIVSVIACPHKLC